MVGGAVYLYPTLFGQTTGDSIPQAEIEFEKKRKRSRNKDINRDLLSSQHIQVRKSWESPGVYAWGNNAGRAVAPDSKETIIKTPRRLSWFDGMLLRDLKIDSAFGAAVTEQGDLVQWGTGYSPENPGPAYTLRGKDIIKLAISRDRILALSKSGSVYSLPVSKTDQLGGAKPSETSSYLSFWSSPGSNIHYRQIQPSNLGWGEKIVDVQSGLEHALLLTSSGRVFSAASSTESYPSRGQLGISGLNWNTRPQGPIDQPLEINSLKGFKAQKIATGDYHSLVLDDQGRIFAFGDNSVGQLGFPAVADATIIDSPSILPLNNLYRGTDMIAKVTSIAAGGANSFFTVDATRNPSSSPTSSSSEVVAPARTLGKVVADTWATGEGIYGCLGTGRWTHISDKPAKIKALSGLFEWDEKANQVIPIRLSRLSVGATHTAAVMDNVTYLDASGTTGANDTNWGADVMWWGGNEYYQLGNGKRTNANAPLYIAPLDGGAADAKAGRKGEEHRFQITPRQTVRLGEGGKGRKVSFEQRVECGRYVTAVYSGT
ncbi:regulator of chromosome condensation 1/beta-lactamase-inhibitor protein II [Coniella lustricola]|uniref:Regulator of chromosome condensation 1/beta-lactamase-inhibitor protein II n=1 Tax=Coniella lustricola TaxID=2025994 RepID=A0A2T3ACD2_9PEZI|nr:regulator of chromosome condensation 1/beta-lactamase-inhibitor protein II [Coniella lustricola]